MLDPDLDKYRRMDPRAFVDAAVDTIAGGVPDDIRADYLASYDGDRFVESMRYVRSYPEQLPALAELLPRIATPVTIINGRHDRVVPLANAEFLDERLPNSRLRIIDAGHFVWEEAPAEYASIILDSISACASRIASTTRVTRGRAWTFETITVVVDGPVLFAEILAPPMNLLGPELVRDLVSLIQRAEADDAYKVLVFKSGDPDYFISHVDLTRVPEYRQEAAKLTGVPSIALLFRHLSASRLVTIAQIEGRVRSGGSEFVLACDMRFAARESAVFAQFESAFGQIPGGGATQYLARLMGRARALEVLLSAEDYDAELAERYGWINRALPASDARRVRSGARPADRADSRLPACSRSRTASTRSPSHRPTTSVAIPISSARRCATPRRNAESKPPCAVACRPETRRWSSPTSSMTWRRSTHHIERSRNEHHAARRQRRQADVRRRDRPDEVRGDDAARRRRRPARRPSTSVWAGVSTSTSSPPPASVECS